MQILDDYGPEQKAEEPALPEVEITLGELNIIRRQVKIK
jgi:hypothetical protein